MIKNLFSVNLSFSRFSIKNCDHNGYYDPFGYFSLLIPD